MWEQFMRKTFTGISVAALIALGLVAGASAAWPGSVPALQVDPWNNARYLIGVKSSAEALRIIDSGQFDINLENEEGYTLLHFAAEAGDLDLVKAMLARGADPHAKNNSVGYTPYQMAYSTLVKAELRKAMSAAQPTTRAAGGAAPPKGAAKAAPAKSNGMCEMARNDPASSSRSPALRPFLAAKDAVWYNKPDELTGLLEDCVPVNQQDEYGWTLLHQAAQRDRVALAKILLNKGASKTLRNKDGQTPGQLATSPEMKALLGGSVATTKPATSRDIECQQKYRADVALCSDSTCRMGSMRKWQQCLKTGNYW
jgi:hypothetical protein